MQATLIAQLRLTFVACYTDRVCYTQWTPNFNIQALCIYTIIKSKTLSVYPRNLYVVFSNH